MFAHPKLRKSSACVPHRDQCFICELTNHLEKRTGGSHSALLSDMQKWKWGGWLEGCVFWRGTRTWTASADSDSYLRLPLHKQTKTKLQLFLKRQGSGKRNVSLLFPSTLNKSTHFTLGWIFSALLHSPFLPIQMKTQDEMHSKPTQFYSTQKPKSASEGFNTV